MTPNPEFIALNFQFPYYYPFTFPHLSVMPPKPDSCLLRLSTNAYRARVTHCSVNRDLGRSRWLVGNPGIILRPLPIPVVELPTKRGGLNRSMQHWLAVYSPEFQSPRSFAGVD